MGGFIKPKYKSVNKRQLLIPKIQRGAKAKVYGNDELLLIDYIKDDCVFFQSHDKTGGGFCSIYEIEAIELMVDVEKYIESMTYEIIEKVTR